MTRYAELQVTTNFSFLRGASHPAEMAVAAAALGLEAIAVTDRNSLAGVVRAHAAAKQAGILAQKKLGLFLCCLSDGEQAQKQLEAAYPQELRMVARTQGVLGGGFHVSDMGAFEKFVVKKISGAEVKDSLNLRQDTMDAFVKAFGNA